MDGNGMVVSNATAAITEIQQTKGLWFSVEKSTVHNLLNAVPETNDWGRILILDFLAQNYKAEKLNEEHI